MYNTDYLAAITNITKVYTSLQKQKLNIALECYSSLPWVWLMSSEGKSYIYRPVL